jgi:hypothetical protein
MASKHIGNYFHSLGLQAETALTAAEQQAQLEAKRPSAQMAAGAGAQEDSSSSSEDDGDRKKKKNWLQGTRARTGQQAK